MATDATSPGTSTSPRPLAVRAAAALAVLVALGVLLQSVWAGGFLAVVYGGGAGGATQLQLHGIGANATFGLLLLEAVAVLLTPLRRVRPVVVSGLVLGGLLVSVIGLGYVGGASVAVHVPLAVATFGVALWHAVAVLGAARATGSGRGSRGALRA